MSIILSALVASVYTSLGGLRSVAYTDVLQLIVVIVGLGLAVPFVIPHGGWRVLWQEYQLVFAERGVPMAISKLGQYLLSMVGLRTVVDLRWHTMACVFSTCVVE